MGLNCCESHLVVGIGKFNINHSHRAAAVGDDGTEWREKLWKTDQKNNNYSTFNSHDPHFLAVFFLKEVAFASDLVCLKEDM